jgi:hypothetical protein
LNPEGQRRGREEKGSILITTRKSVLKFPSTIVCAVPFLHFPYRKESNVFKSRYLYCGVAYRSCGKNACGMAFLNGTMGQH